MDDFIQSLLTPTGLKYNYHSFTKPPALPYLLYVYEEDQHGADDKNMIDHAAVTVEFYSEVKDPVSEKKVESALSAYEWKKHSTYFEEDDFWQTTYDFEIYRKL